MLKKAIHEGNEGVASETNIIDLTGETAQLFNSETKPIAQKRKVLSILKFYIDTNKIKLN